jgi:hypothetical protein
MQQKDQLYAETRDTQALGGDMQTLHLFVRDFCLGFVVTSGVALVIWLGRVVSLDGNASSVGRKHFIELSKLSEDDQERILHAADRQAFSGWRFAVLPSAYAALLSGSIAASRTLQELGILPVSLRAKPPTDLRVKTTHL